MYCLKAELSIFCGLIGLCLCLVRLFLFFRGFHELGGGGYDLLIEYIFVFIITFIHGGSR